LFSFLDYPHPNEIQIQLGSKVKNYPKVIMDLNIRDGKEFTYKNYDEPLFKRIHTDL